MSKIYSKAVICGNANFELKLPLPEVWLKKCILGSVLVVREDHSKKTDPIRGWGSLSSVSNREVYWGVVEDSIYVDPEYQGMGIGNLLLGN
ncbi:GNAT family N-acetyltransferase [Methanobacterium sp. BAmetb5]|uniref:GNAT family N-acetyltransferase n=1 Tax=Methanobacterium sp. BAmetb5 TaxID=2025351 RepID=UPI0025EC6B4C|nr:GNAT family N-acetyltransferase [Methanobacterium sp. BAmetb5]